MSKRYNESSGALVPTRRLKFSDDFNEWFSGGEIGKYVSSVNPSSGPGARNEGLSSIHVSALDYYAENPAVLPFKIFQTIRTMESWITQKMPMKFTESNQVMWTQFILESGPSDMAARGTLASQLSVRKESQRMVLTYHSIGCAQDLYVYKKYPGLFELHVKQIISDFYQSIMFDCVAKLRTGIFAYCNPEVRMPDITMPTTIEDADRIIRSRYCEITKDGLGVGKIAQRVAEMLGAQGEVLDGFIIERDNVDLIKSDSDRKFYFIEGSNAVSNRTKMSDPVNIPFYQVPVLSSTRNNDMEARILSSQVQTGSIGTHVNARVRAAPGKWRTSDTDFEMASWDTNGYDTYRKRDTFQHSLIFNACDYIRESRDPNFKATYKNAESEEAGQINRKLMDEFIRTLPSTLTKARVKYTKTNIAKCHPLIRLINNEKFIDPLKTTQENNGTGQWTTIMVAGEISEHFANRKHIMHAIKTAAVVLFEGFSPEDLILMESEIQVEQGDQENRQKLVKKKEKQNQLREIVFNRLKVCMPAASTVFDVNTLFNNGFLFVPSETIIDNGPPEQRQKDAFDFINLKNAKVQEHFQKFGVPEIMVKRLEILKNETYPVFIAGIAYLFNEISVPSLVRQCDTNIDTVLGAKVARPWEMQWVRAVAAVAQGPLGTIYHNAPLDTVTEDMVRKQGQFTREMQFGAAFQFDRRVCLVEHAAGSDIVGGSGRDWFIDIGNRPEKLDSRNGEYFRTLDSAMFRVQQLKRDPSSGDASDPDTHGCAGHSRIRNHTNFALITGMSECIGVKSHDKSIDLCGFPDRNNYIGVMHDCRAFDEMHQPEFQSDSTAWSVFAHNFLEHKRYFAPEGFPYNKYSLEHLSAVTHANTLCHPTTIVVTDEFGQKRTLEGRHLRGFQGQNCRMIDSGAQRHGYVEK